MPCVDSVPWNGVDSATERGERTKLPRRREGCRVSENSKGGDCWVSQLSLFKEVVRGFEKTTRTRGDLRCASEIAAQREV